MAMIAGAFKHVHGIRFAFIDALVFAVDADRPIHGAGANTEHGFEFGHQVVRIASEVVDFIDKSKNRNAAISAYAEEFFRLRFDAFRHVDQHDGAVRRHQCAVRVLRKVLVTRRIQNIDAVSFVIELQNGTRDRDAALLFDFHPVGNGVPRRFARLDRTGEVDRAAVK